MSTRTHVINGRIQNDPVHHSPHIDPAKPGDDRHQSEYEQKQYLKAHAREKDGLMKQFCKLEGPSGNSAAFQRGWEAAFGTPEQKARALAEIAAEKAEGVRVLAGGMADYPTETESERYVRIEREDQAFMAILAFGCVCGASAHDQPAPFPWIWATAHGACQ